MIETWLAWARGPIFLFALSFMVLGLARQVGLTVWEVVRAMRRAGDKTLPYRQVVTSTLKWMFFIGKFRDQFAYSLTSVLFHVSILVVPLFLAGHVVLWQAVLGIPWLTIPNTLADVLTVLAVVTAVALVVQRATARATRALSRPQDYALPLWVAVPFATGFFAMHPGLDPLPHSAMLLAHVLSADLLLVLIPITKLSHVVLLPIVQLVSEVGWRWPADGGSRLAVTLGKENEPI